MRCAISASWGTLQVLTSWRYEVAVQYKGFAQDPGQPDSQVADINLTVGIGIGDLTFGKTKQTFGYEMVGDAADLPQEERLLTPFGLRSLAPGHPDYKSKYYGDLRSRDAAYHQGTVWAWLIGPFLDAWLKVHPDDRPGAQKLLAGFDQHLSDACVGSIGEIFDAEPPYVPRGCVAQAWSVAEVLRAMERTRAGN